MFYLACGMAMVIFISICIEIFMRYFLNRPQIWAVEVTEYAMLYLTFLGAAWLLREEGHVRLDIIFVLLKPRSQALLSCLTSIFGIIVFSVLVFYGTWSTWLHYQKGLRTFSVMEILKWPFLVVIPFGSLLLLIQFIRRTYGYWEEFRSNETEQ
jgi:TRAP-type C4-dicarboxylate transport system permease small subunit